MTLLLVGTQALSVALGMGMKSQRGCRRQEGVCEDGERQGEECARMEGWRQGEECVRMGGWRQED